MILSSISLLIFFLLFFNSFANDNLKEITVTSSKLLDEQLTGTITHVLTRVYQTIPK